MTCVSDQNIECPVCHGNTAHTDLNIHTNEREWDCERCGFHSHTRIVERVGGKLLWEATYELPMSPEGKVAWPEMQAVKGGTWNRKEFGVMPGFEKEEKMTEAFGVEEAE